MATTSVSASLDETNPLPSNAMFQRLFRPTLLTVLRWGCPSKDPNISYEHYLLKIKKISNWAYTHNFSEQERKCLSCDPTGESFDTSLLCRLIQVACDYYLGFVGHGRAPDAELEGLIAQVLNMQSEFYHTVSFQQYFATAAKDTLIRLLISAGKKYKVPQEEIEKLIDEVIENVESCQE